MKKETVNTFTEGLSLDSHELSTSNNSLSYALNATLITRNGDEFVLQNDMGNGRVETAFLPAGFVPVGVKEHAGIIYVASHNPISNKNQIGSFPSPERNIMSEEVVDNKEDVKLSQSDFYDGTKIKTAYIKKSLIDEEVVKIRPGDKFLVGVKDLNNSLSYVVGSDKESSVFPKFIRLHLAVIADDNTISYLEETENNYWKPVEIKKEGSDSGGDFTLEGYRDFINNNYIIYTSKISGTLAIIAELDSLDSYEVQWKYDITKEDNGDYNIKLSAFNTWETQNLNPYAIGHELTYSNRPEITIYETSDGKEFSKNIKSLAFPNEIDDPLEIISSREEFIKNAIFKYKSTPSMFYGSLNHLTREGIVDLSKINSGIIDLTSYRYYVDVNSKLMTMTWGVNAYLKDYQSIENVYIDYIEFKDAKKIGSSLTWDHPSIKRIKLKNRINYLGTFEDTFELDNGEFKSNSFYFNRLVIDVKENNNLIEEYVTVNRFLYTTGIFNRNYIIQDYDDFNDILLKGYVDINTTLKPVTSTPRQLGKYIDIPPLLSGESVEKSVSCYSRSDFEQDFKLDVSFSIRDSEGLNRFYGNHNLDEILEVSHTVNKSGIEHNLSEENSVEQVSSGKVEDLYNLVKFKYDEEKEFLEYDKDPYKDTEKYSVSYNDSSNTVNLKATTVKRGAFNYEKGSYKADSILEPFVDISDKNKMRNDLIKILGVDNMVISNSELFLSRALLHRQHQGSHLWYHVTTCKLLPSSKQTESQRVAEEQEWRSSKSSAGDKTNYPKLNERTHSNHFFLSGPAVTGFNYIINKYYSFGNAINLYPLVVYKEGGRPEKSKGPRVMYTLPVNSNTHEPCFELTYGIGEVSRQYRSEGMMTLGFPTPESNSANHRFRLINAKTSINNYDGGSSINGVSSPYKKSMLNLITTLYSQLFRVSRSNLGSQILYAKAGSLCNVNKLQTLYKFNITNEIVNKPDNVFGDFNKNYIKNNFNGLIKNLSLNNIPDSNTFELGDSTSVNEHSFFDPEYTTNDLISKLREELEVRSLARIPIISENGGKVETVIKPINHSLDKNTLYFYDVRDSEIKKVPSEETEWLRDDDYIKLERGVPKMTNIGKFLNYNGTTITMGSSSYVGFVRGENKKSDIDKYFSFYIHEPYIFEETKLIVEK